MSFFLCFFRSNFLSIWSCVSSLLKFSVISCGSSGPIFFQFLSRVSSQFSCNSSCVSSPNFLSNSFMRCFRFNFLSISFKCFFPMFFQNFLLFLYILPSNPFSCSIFWIFFPFFSCFSSGSILFHFLSAQFSFNFPSCFFRSHFLPSSFKCFFPIFFRLFSCVSAEPNSGLICQGSESATIL